MQRSLLFATWLVGAGFALLAVLLVATGRLVDGLSVGAGVAALAVVMWRR